MRAAPGEGRRGDMRAGAHVARAVVIEHHPAAKARRGDPHAVLHRAVLHRAGNSVVLELHGDAARQPEAAASGQRASVEDATKVLGGKRRRHSAGRNLGGWRCDSARDEGSMRHHGEAPDGGQPGKFGRLTSGIMDG